MSPSYTRSLIVGITAAGLVGMQAGPVFSAESPLPPGTHVSLEFARSVSSRTAHQGDTVPLRVYADVTVHGHLIIRRGAPAEGVVTKVHHRRTFGRKGELRIRLVQVRDVKGRKVPLEAYKSGHRFSAGGPGAAGAGLLVFGPLGLVAGAFVKGGEVTIDQGTRIEAEVAAPH